MRVPRLYCPLPLSVGSNVSLAREQAHYLGTVLRLRAGAAVILFNGDGTEYDGVVASIDRKQSEIRLYARRQPQCESPLNLCLALGISRGERMTYAIQKAVEVGVTRIQPLVTEYCEMRAADERTGKRQQHWQAIVHSACEQSGRTRLPEVSPAQPLDAWLETLPPEAAPKTDLRLALDPKGAVTFHAVPADASEVTLLVGPEGGLGAMDLAAADRTGFVRIRLGPRVLRTETAAVAALVAAQLLWGDLR